MAIVTFSIDTPTVPGTAAAIEDESNSITFNFDVELEPGEEAPSEANPVTVLFFASNSDAANIFDDASLSGDVRLQQINQLNVFTLTPTGLSAGWDPLGADDVSVTYEAASVPDFSVFRIPITSSSGTVSLDAFFDFIPEDPSEYFWRVVDEPGGRDNTIINSAVPFLEVDTRADIPAGNAAPVAAADTASTDFGEAVTVDVLGNDTDADGDTLSLSSVTQGDNGAVTIVNGEAVYTPNAGFSGSDSFTYEVSDGNGGTDTGTVNVTVGEAPATPVVSISAVGTTLIEDQGNAVTLTFTIENLPADGLDLAVGLYRPGDSGQDLIERGIGDYDAFNAELDGILGSPFGFTDNSGFAFRAVSETVTVTLPIFDDNDALPGEPGNNANSDFGIEQHVWRLIDFSRANPPFNVLDDYDINPEASEVTVTLRDTANFDPEADDESYSTGFQAALVVVPANGVLDGDTDLDGDTLSATVLSGPANGTLELGSNGGFTYTPDAGFSGEDSFTYTVSDGNGGTDTGTVSITVDENPNSDPNAVDDSVTAGFETTIIVPVLGNDTDPDGDDLTVTSLGTPSNGSVQLVEGVVEYTPNDGFSGEDSFTYTVSDGNGGTSTATVTVTVEEEPNQDPVANDDISSTNFGQPVSINVLGNDSDPNGDPVTLLDAFNGAGGTVEIVDGEIVYTPNEGFSGVDTFTYTISDGEGGTDEGEVTVTVGEQPNRAPDATDDIATTEFGAAVAVDVLGNDTDLDGDTLEITGFGTPANGTVELIDGQLVYTPNEGFSGVDTFTYTISDGEGGTDEGEVTVTVGEQPNRAPDATDDIATTEFGAAVAVDVLGNDTDLDGDTLEITGFGTPANGTVELIDGQLVYTPNEGFSGVDTFTYTISDGEGGTDEGEVTVTVGEQPNRAPDATDDIATTEFGAAVAVDVLGNDTDLDGDTLEITGFGTPANGAVELIDGQLVYTPNEGFSGVDTFTYTISDGEGGTDEGEVTVTVGEQPNRAPDATDDIATTEFGAAVAVDVLGNDTDLDGDTLEITGFGTPANGTVELIDGQLVYTPNEGFSGVDTFTYTISDGEGGTDEGEVTVTVGDAPTLPVIGFTVDTETLVEDEGTRAVITFTVEGDIPEGGVQVPIFLENINLDGDVVDDRPLGDFEVFFAQLDGVQFVRAYGANDGLTLNILEDGATVTLPIFDDNDAAPGEPGNNVNSDIGIEETTFRLANTDDTGASFDGFVISPTEGSFTVTLKDTNNEAPVAADDAATTAFGEAVTVDVLGNDTDPDGDVLTIASVGEAANGTVELVDGQLVYTPDAGFSGSDTFTYDVSDGSLSATGEVTITVEEELDPSLNLVTGTAGSDYLVGTTGDDLIRGEGGSYDRLFGDEGADTFVFAEGGNGSPDRDLILDYEAGVDSILLEGDTQLADFREVGGKVYLLLEGGDGIVVQGSEALTFEDLTIETDTFEFV